MTDKMSQKMKSWKISLKTIIDSRILNLRKHINSLPNETVVYRAMLIDQRMSNRMTHTPTRHTDQLQQNFDKDINSLSKKKLNTLLKDSYDCLWNIGTKNLTRGRFFMKLQKFNEIRTLIG